MRVDIQAIINKSLKAQVDGIIPNSLEAQVCGLISRGVKSAEIDANGHLIFTLTDDSTVDLGKVVGDDGADGADGADGVGIQSVTKTGTVGKVDTYTITKTDGTTSTFTVTNGNDGATGAKGDKGDKGDDGDKGDKGDTGETGATGATGATGNGIQSISKTSTSGKVDTYTITFTNGTTATFTVTNGNDGQNGQDGQDGQDGEDGVSPTVATSKSGKTTTITITDATGSHTATVLDGNDGEDGQDGSDGEDGYSPSASVSKSGKTATISITDKTGTTTTTVIDGNDGQNGSDGAAATISVGTVTTGAAGTQVEVTNVGTSSAAVFNFKIPKGDKGDAGSGSGDMLASTYDPAGGARQVAFANEIPDALSDLSDDATHRLVTDSNISAWNAKYTKPSGGIPKTDLASAVQTSLGLADSALQSYTEVDPIFSASVAYGITSSDISNWNGKLDASQKGSASGVAELDANGKVPSSQLPSDVFIATITYSGGTYSSDKTYAEIVAASVAGKVCLAKSDNATYYLCYIANNKTYFFAVDENYTESFMINSSNVVTYDSWSSENPDNKVSAWSATTSNYRYPSEKLVKDSLDAKYVKPSGGIPASDLAQSYYLASNPNGYTDNTVANSKYTKPASGIPSTDMTSAVQASLALADTALQEHQSLSAYSTTSQMNTAIAAHHDSTKQDTISDLATIRSGASAGATAVQPEAGKGLFSGSYTDLTNKPTIPAAQVNSDWNASSGVAQILNKPTIPTVPTNVSAFTNDAGYLTSHQSLSAYRTASAQDTIDAGKQAQHISDSAHSLTGGSSAWASNQQTVSGITGVTATNTVIVSPAPSGVSDWAEAGIYCSTQASGSLTFVCETVPTNNISLNIVILG